MSSFFQYRRLRRQVQDDLALAQHAERSSTSLPKPRDRESKEDGPTEDYLTKMTLVPGVLVSHPEEGQGSVIFEVGWKENDPSNPLNWTLGKKWWSMMTYSALAIPLTMLTSIEGPTLDAFSAYFRVNAEAGSMTVGQTSLAD